MNNDICALEPRAVPAAKALDALILFYGLAAVIGLGAAVAGWAGRGFQVIPERPVVLAWGLNRGNGVPTPLGEPAAPSRYGKPGAHSPSGPILRAGPTPAGPVI